MKKIKIIGLLLMVLASFLIFITLMSKNTKSNVSKSEATINPSEKIEIEKETIGYGDINKENNIDMNKAINIDSATQMLGLYYNNSISNENKMLNEALLTQAKTELQNSNYTFKLKCTDNKSQELSDLQPVGASTTIHCEGDTSYTITQQSTFFTIAREGTDLSSVDEEDYKFYTSPFIVKYSNLIRELGTKRTHITFENPYNGVILNFKVINSNKEVLAQTGDVLYKEMFLMDIESVCKSKYNNLYIVLDIYDATTGNEIIKGLWNNEMITN